MDYSASNIQRSIQSGVMAIIRIDSPKDVLPTVETLARGGIEFFEISLVTPLVAVGGITVENLPAFFKAGVCGVARASSLADPRLIADGLFQEITQISARCLEAAHESRES